ncbi:MULTISPECIES: hypothetical protein [Arthrobacter]|uniref:hypothetical protein n=1 Tax=Arthrobacter TaxID=1663 RepID=UPI00197A7140|nr:MULTISPECIES: hypothetical protein [Arthrobacter]MBT8160552.1 hypothetical protein [Arthrobacter sp. GN70]
MKRAAKAGIVVGGVVAVGLAGAITLNASQVASHSEAAAPPSATASAAAPSPAKSSSAAPGTPSAAPASPAASSPSAAPSAAPAAPAAPAPAATAAAPAPAPAAPAAPAPAPGAGGLTAAQLQHIEDSCTARLQADAASSSVVSGTVVPRPFTVVSISFAGAPVASTGTSGLPAHDILMNTTTKLVDGPTQEGQRVCRVYDTGTKVDWLPVG